MAEMTRELMEMIDNNYCYWGTASRDGVANVAIYRGTIAASPDTIIVTSGVVGKTFDNIRETPKASVVVYAGLPTNKSQATPQDFEKVGGGQVKGTATIHTSGEVFEQAKAKLAARRGASSSAAGIKAVIVLKVEEIYSIGVAPGAGKRIA